MVRGYDGEPYARVGPDGVFVNDNSPAVYLNSDRFGATAMPTRADPKQDPAWRKVFADAYLRWRDHRAHWMLNTLPQAVAAAPGEFHRISTWTVILDYDGQELTATGTLDWVPGPAPWGWLAIAALLTAMVVAAVALMHRPQWALAAATAVLVAADMVHAVGIGLATAGVFPQRFGVFIGVIVGQAMAWLIGTFAVVLLARGRLGAVWLAAIAGVAVALTSGLPDLPTLSRSSAPSALPIDAARATIVAALGVGLGLLIALVLVVRRQRRSLLASAAEGMDRGAAGLTPARPQPERQPR